MILSLSWGVLFTIVFAFWSNCRVPSWSCPRRCWRLASILPLQGWKLLWAAGDTSRYFEGSPGWYCSGLQYSLQGCCPRARNGTTIWGWLGRLWVVVRSWWARCRERSCLRGRRDWLPWPFLQFANRHARWRDDRRHPCGCFWGWTWNPQNRQYRGDSKADLNFGVAAIRSL